MNLVDKILVDPITRGLKFFTKGGVPAYVSQVRGRTDGSAPAAGDVGETVQGIRTSGSGIGLTSNVFADVTSVLLTAGRWRLDGLVGQATGGTTTNSSAAISINSGNTTTDHAYGNNASSGNIPTTANDGGVPIPGYIVNITSSTTYYLKATQTFSSGSPVAYGRLIATRLP